MTCRQNNQCRYKESHFQLTEINYTAERSDGTRHLCSYMGLAKLWYCLSIIEPSHAMHELSNDSSIDSSSDSAMPRTGAPGMYRGLGLNKLGRPFQLSSSTSRVDVDPYSVPSGLEFRGVVPRDA